MDTRCSYALVNICVDLQKIKKNVKFSDKNDKLIYFKNNDLIKLVCGKHKKSKNFENFCDKS